MNRFFADFHIHIGRAAGKPVKMAAAPSLTLVALLDQARRVKGLDIVTVIDGVCTGVLSEIREMLEQGRLVAHPGGGLLHDNGLLVLLGAEVETAGPRGGSAHFGCWFGNVDAAADFREWLASVQKNVSLSSQRANVTAATLQAQTRSRDGLFVVHHAFTPHRGVYGNCVSHLAEMVDADNVDGLELGLSADTDMADCLSELDDVTYLSNSDAHSLPKIAREFNEVELTSASFAEVRLALHRQAGRAVVANYGLRPELGKYYRTRCLACGSEKTATACACGSRRFVSGVYERLLEVRDRAAPVHPAHRPPYVHQVPLEFVPGIGAQTRQRLLEAFGTEMDILRRVSAADLAAVIGPKLAHVLVGAQTGDVAIDEGGGGRYGRLSPGGTLPSTST